MTRPAPHEGRARAVAAFALAVAAGAVALCAAWTVTGWLTGSWPVAIP